MNKICRHLSKLQMRMTRKYYTLQILVLLIYDHETYLNFFYRQEKIERYLFQIVSVDERSNSAIVAE